MKKLIVIALAMVLLVGLSAGVALAGYDWKVDLDGFSDGNFRAGGTVFGSSPGYLTGLSATGYAVEAGVAVTGGEGGGEFGLLGKGNEEWAMTKLDEHYVIPFWCWEIEGGTFGKTIEVFQQLEQTEIVTNTTTVTTLMRQAFTAVNAYPEIQMKQEVNRIGPDLTYQFIEGSALNGSEGGFVQSYTVQNGVVNGLLGAEIGGGYFYFMGHNIVDYTDDTADAWGWYDLWGGF